MESGRFFPMARHHDHPLGNWGVSLNVAYQRVWTLNQGLERNNQYTMENPFKIEPFRAQFQENPFVSWFLDCNDCATQQGISSNLQWPLECTKKKCCALNMSLTNGTKSSTHEQCSPNWPSVFSQGCNFPFHATAAAIKGLLGSVRMLIHLCVSESVTPSLQRSTQNQVIEISKVRDRDKCKFSDFK